MKNKNNLILLLFTLVSSGLMILSFPEFNAYYLAFFAMVPLIIIIENEKSLIKTIICVELFVLIFYTYLLHWVMVFHYAALPGLLFYLLLIFPAPIIFYRAFRIKRKHPMLNILLLTFILTLFEQIRNIGFMKFPYGNLAYSQYNFTTFIQISDKIGALGVSFILYFINICIATFIVKLIKDHQAFSKFSSKIFSRITLAIIVFIFVYSYGYVKTRFYQFEENYISQVKKENSKIKVGMIQPWFDFNKPWDEETQKEIYDKLINQTLNISDDNLDLIIWPESSIIDYYDFQIKNNFEQLTEARKFYNFFNAYGKQFKKTKFLVGASALEFLTSTNINNIKKNDGENRAAKDFKTSDFIGVKKYNVVLLIDHEGKVLAKRGKRNLVAFAEYFPYKWVYNYIPILEKFLDEAHASSFSPYLKYNTIKFEKGDFAPLICYDSVFSELSRILVLKGSKFLVVITNDAWSYSTKSQVIHYAFSVFRAIENRRHLVRVGNAGITTLILPNGKAKGDLEMFKETSMISEFTPNEEITFYTLYGDLLFYVFIIVFAVYYFGLVGFFILPIRLIKKVVSIFKK